MMPSKQRHQALQLPALGRMVVLVPSHNEELSIARCVASIAASAGGTEDILVVAHNCEDGTAEIARASGATVSVLEDHRLRGKGSALAHGFRIAFEDLRADAVLVIDADSTVSVNMVRGVRQRLADASVLQCRYECRSVLEDPKSRLRALAFFCMNVVRPMGRHRLHLSSGIFGNGFAVRRELMERVPYAAHSIIEDIEFHLSVVAAGYRCEFLEEASVCAEVPTAAQGAATQSARWEGGRLRMLRFQGPSLLRQVLRGRGSLLAPLVNLAGLPLAMEMICLVELLIFPVHLLRVYAASGMAVIALHLLFAICVGPEPSANLRALVQAPFYMVSKLGMLPGIFRMTRARAMWVRTARAVAPGQSTR
jgi:cellulose synthase/poly-beta-1,6-N-acetylglucosamine synthase-like glycosyltransferase